MRTIQKLMGHKHISTTALYCDISDEMLRNAVELVWLWCPTSGRYIVKLQPRYPSKGNVGSAAMSAIGVKADIPHISSDVR